MIRYWFKISLLSRPVPVLVPVVSPVLLSPVLLSPVGFILEHWRPNLLSLSSYFIPCGIMMMLMTTELLFLKNNKRKKYFIVILFISYLNENTFS